MKAFVVALCLAVVAGLFVWVGTADGMRYGQRDSATYVSSAESLANGDGFRAQFGDPGKAVRYDEVSSPVVDFPPGYPLALSGVIALGVDAKTAAMAMAVSIAVAITLLIFALARRRGLGLWASSVAAVVGAGLTIQQSFAPQSEPLYGLLLVGAVWAGAEYLRSRGLWQLMVALGLTAMAVTVRTVGLALVATLMLLVVLAERTLVRRMVGAILVGVVGVIPFLATTASGTRVISWHPMDLADLKIFANAVVGWLVPPVGGPVLRVVLLVVALAALVIWLLATKQRRPVDGVSATSPFPLWYPGAISAGTHLGLLVVTIFLFDSQTYLGPRLIYPMALSLLMAGVEFYAVPGESRASQMMARAMPYIAGAAVLAAVWGSAASATSSIGGLGDFASDDFANSDTVIATVDAGGEYAVFSNVPDGLWVAGLAGVTPLPVVVDPLSDLPSPRLVEEMATLEEEVDLNDGLIFFYRGHERPYLLDEAAVDEVAPCTISDDGQSVLKASESHPLCPET